MFELRPISPAGKWAVYITFGAGDISILRIKKGVALCRVENPQKIEKYVKVPPDARLEDYNPQVIMEFNKRKSLFWFIWELLIVWIRFNTKKEGLT